MEVRQFARPIAVNGEITVSSEWAVAAGQGAAARIGVILAHGAGNDMRAPFLVHMQKAWAREGMLVVRFNFPYKERGAKAPDRPALLEATWRAVARAVRDDSNLAPTHLFFAGKSLGGRIASHLAAAGEACAGLVFLGYPLHPARQPQKLRAAHLANIASPMLYIAGTRDPLCDLDLLRSTLREVKAPAIVHVIEGGDHSFKLPRAAGRAENEVWDEIAGVSVSWMRKIALPDSRAE